MKWWERLLWGGFISQFTGGIDLQKTGRRKTDMVTDEQVKQIANNGETTKELVARNYLENKVEHAEIRTTQGWHSKIITGLLTAILGGFVALIFFVIRNSLGG
jgi:hypothetical protein